jgi:hypothetical protein
MLLWGDDVELLGKKEHLGLGLDGLEQAGL